MWQELMQEELKQHLNYDGSLRSLADFYMKKEQAVDVETEEIKFLQNLESQLAQLNTMNLDGLATYLVDNFDGYKEVLQLLLTGKNHYRFLVLCRKIIMELRNSEDCMRWFIENIARYNNLVRLEKEEQEYATASKDSSTSPEKLQQLWNTVWERYKKPDSHTYAI